MNNKPDPKEILSRIFETFPPDGMTRFEVGDTVELVRPYFLWKEIPRGAIGIVKSVETEGINADKGRPYEVEFDLLPFQIPTPDYMKILARQRGIPEDQIPPHHISMTTHFSPNDLRKVDAS